MGAGFQQTEPEQCAGQKVGIGRANADPLQTKNQQDACTGDQEAASVQSAGIEQGNNQYRDDVVDDRQGQQEHPHRGRHGTPE
ncbi:hypothetical protein D9M69_512670 [compost metagenome]